MVYAKTIIHLSVSESGKYLPSRIMCTIDTRDQVSINTTNQHLDQPTIDISVDPQLTHSRHLGQQTLNFR